MSEVYLIEVYEKQVSGFTTYKNELCQCLFESGHKINKIVFGASTDELLFRYEDNVKELLIPAVLSFHLELIGYYLRLYISDGPSTVFMLNFSPSYDIVKLLKEFFQKSRIVYVIHDFIWLTELNGNIESFKLAITEGCEKQNVQRSIEDGMKTFHIVDKVVCLSSDTYKLLEEVYSVEKDKLAYIPNGLKDSFYILSEADKIKIRAKLHITEDEIVFLYVGRVSKQKGILDMLGAFEKLHERFSNFRLIIVGSIPTGFHQYIPYSIRNKVLLFGAVERELLYELYSISNVGVIASHYEQCSYVGIEMQMFSLPIIASDAFGVKCMFDDANALLYHFDSDENRTIMNLLDTINVMLCKSTIELCELKKRARIAYECKYNIIRMQEDYNQLLASI